MDERLVIRQIKPIDIPVRLLLQKESWNPEEFCRCAIVATNWYAYVWGEIGEEWAAIVLVDDAIYNSVLWDTLIVDRDHRKRVAEVVRAGFQICEVLAKALGRKYMTTCTNKPKAYLRMIGNPADIEEVEIRLRKEV